MVIWRLYCQAFVKPQTRNIAVMVFVLRLLKS